MHMQSDTGKCTRELTRSTPCLASNNLHQAGPSKPIYNDACKHKN